MNDIPIASTCFMAYSLIEVYNRVLCPEKLGGMEPQLLCGHLLGALTCNWFTRYS